eukprot:5263441-Alexandrium_andersonii.AAC.1
MVCRRRACRAKRVIYGRYIPWMAPREPWAWRGQQQTELGQPPQAKPAGKGKGSKKDKDKD